MSEQEQDRHATDETDEPDVEAHLMDTLGREDAANEREAVDSFGDREQSDTAEGRHRHG